MIYSHFGLLTQIPVFWCYLHHHWWFSPNDLPFYQFSLTWLELIYFGNRSTLHWILLTPMLCFCTLTILTTLTLACQFYFFLPFTSRSTHHWLHVSFYWSTFAAIPRHLLAIQLDNLIDSTLYIILPLIAFNSSLLNALALLNSLYHRYNSS